MEQQRGIYLYNINPMVNYNRTLSDLKYTFGSCNNLFIVSHGFIAVSLLIRLAEELQMQQVASKIRQDLGLFLVGEELFPKMSILMSRVMDPELPFTGVTNSMMFIDYHNNCLKKAYDTLAQGKILMLFGVGASIPHLITFFVTLREFDVVARTFISTSTRASNLVPVMEIVLHGASTLLPYPPPSIEPHFGLLSRLLRLDMPLQNLGLSVLLPAATDSDIQAGGGQMQRNLDTLPQPTVPIWQSHAPSIQIAPDTASGAKSEDAQSSQRQQPAETSDPLAQFGDNFT